MTRQSRFTSLTCSVELLPFHESTGHLILEDDSARRGPEGRYPFFPYAPKSYGNAGSSEINSTVLFSSRLEDHAR